MTSKLSPRGSGRFGGFSRLSRFSRFGGLVVPPGRGHLGRRASSSEITACGGGTIAGRTRWRGSIASATRRRGTWTGRTRRGGLQFAAAVIVAGLAAAACS